MRKIIAASIGFLTTISFNLYGQSDNNKIIATTLQTNIFYVGLNNVVSIGTNDGSKHEFILEPFEALWVYTSSQDSQEIYPGVSIDKIEGNRYNIIISKRTTPYLNLAISEVVDGKKIYMGDMFFKIRSVPRPVADFGGAIVDGFCDLEELRKIKVMKTQLNGFLRKDFVFRITGYKFMAVGRYTNGPKFIRSNNAGLEPIYPILEQLQEGDLITFTDIIAQGPDGVGMILDNVSCKIQKNKNTLLDKVNEQLENDIRNDSIASSMVELKETFTKNISLNKQSLTKHLIEYFHKPNFNDLFEKKISMFELQNGALIPYKFSEVEEFKKDDGFVQNKLVTIPTLKPGVYAEDAIFEVEDYYDTIVIQTIKAVPIRVYFDQFKLNESAEDWFMFVEFRNRTLVIPVTEFLKERNICPSMMCEYLSYLKINKPKDFRKYKNIAVSDEFTQLISKGWLNFFKNVAEHHLSKLYFTLITGTTKGFEDVINSHSGQIESIEWSKLIDFNSLSVYSNYNPVWFEPESVTNLEFREIKHKDLIESVSQPFNLRTYDEDTILYRIELNNIKGFNMFYSSSQNQKPTPFLTLYYEDYYSQYTWTRACTISFETVYPLLGEMDKILFENIHMLNYENNDLISSED